MSLITFHELIPHRYPPIRAEKAGFGQLPARVHKCEPARSASGFGWYVHLPLDFQVVFDGVDCIISFDEGENYLPLTELWYPNFADRFNALVPENCRGYPPPYVAMTEDHSILQIWTGYIVRTQPDYSVWVRSPVNYLAQTAGYYHLEGIIETDRWTGHLFSNIKLLRTDAPIHFHIRRPFLQLVPIRRDQYADRLLNDFEVKTGDAAFEGVDWEAYNRIIVHPNAYPKERRMAAYAAEARKRRAQEENQ